VQLGSGELAATVIFPAGATQKPQDVQLDLSSGVTKQGATPANNTVIRELQHERCHAHRRWLHRFARRRRFR
jgi:hypothetical protein